jgi:hypothetical protein
MIARRPFLLSGVAAILASLGARRTSGQTDLPEDALTPIRERYLNLQSYADTGTVLTEVQWPGAPVAAESGSFTTFYRAPRNFFFDFVEDEASGSDRYVLWCDGGDFQSWWKATGVHDVYDGGRGVLGFLAGESPTMGTAMVIPGLIFARAEVGGAVAGLREAREDGEEAIDGKTYKKIYAETHVVGNMTRRRPTTIWIDPDTLLIHKVVEDLSEGGNLDRQTTVLAPEADIEIPDDRFTFAVPG